jgi:hypothetical protein
MWSTILALLMSMAAAPQAQMSSADLKGSVLDPSKAVIAGAAVTATNVNTGVMRSTVTDQSGEYRIALLQPGEYEVRVNVANFSPQVRRGIMLTVVQNRSRRFQPAGGDGHE